jgi:hypothetical protein
MTDEFHCDQTIARKFVYAPPRFREDSTLNSHSFVASCRFDRRIGAAVWKAMQVVNGKVIADQPMIIVGRMVMVMRMLHRGGSGSTRRFCPYRV